MVVFHRVSRLFGIFPDVGIPILFKHRPFLRKRPVAFAKAVGKDLVENSPFLSGRTVGSLLIYRKLKPTAVLGRVRNVHSETEFVLGKDPVIQKEEIVKQSPLFTLRADAGGVYRKIKPIADFRALNVQFLPVLVPDQLHDGILRKSKIAENQRKIQVFSILKGRKQPCFLGAGGLQLHPHLIVLQKLCHHFTAFNFQIRSAYSPMLRSAAK